MKSSNDNTSVLIGRRIRSLRNERGWSQQELGDNAEVNYKFVGEIERGQQNPSLNTLVKIAAALNVDLPDLFCYEHEITNRKDIEKKICEIIQNIQEEELRQIFLIIRSLCPAHIK